MNETRNVASRGVALELRTAADFQAHGYLVRRGVKLAVAAGTAEATDIDLLAIRFNTPLNEQRLIADCKDRKKTHPFERILWTMGLTSFSSATEAVVVLPRAPWQARDFAAQGNVEILTADEMDASLETSDRSIRPFGDADLAFSNAYLPGGNRSQKFPKNLVREDLRLRQMLVISYSLTNLNRIFRTLCYWFAGYLIVAGDLAAH